MSIRLLITDPNEQTRRSVHLLNQASAHVRTAVSCCLCAAGLLAGVKVLRSASSIKILPGFSLLLVVLLHVVLHVSVYDARSSQRNPCVSASAEVLSAVLLKMQVLWNVVPCRQ
jgi:hypothetical protein